MWRTIIISDIAKFHNSFFLIVTMSINNLYENEDVDKMFGNDVWNRTRKSNTTHTKGEIKNVSNGYSNEVKIRFIWMTFIRKRKSYNSGNRKIVAY